MSARKSVKSGTDSPKRQNSLSIPESHNTVDVAIIDTTTRMGNVPASHYQGPSGHYSTLSTPGTPTPSYSFYIFHPSSKTKLLFDLGLRTDWESASSTAIRRWVRDSKVHVSVEKNVATILREGCVDPMDIDAVIFSHQHFDHTGDINKFSRETSIIVGPGYQKHYLPGWPKDRKCWETTSDLYEGREIVELAFPSIESPAKALKIGQLDAFDYFGDGSFYLLNTPGHTIGHLSALARTTPGATGAKQDKESTFILLGGDVAHGCALLRPNTLSPLPHKIEFQMTGSDLNVSYDGNAIASMHYAHSSNDDGTKAKTTPFCCATGPHHNVEAAQWSIDGVSELDGKDNIFTVLAHDPTLDGVVELFPQAANEWKSKGWRERCRWTFIQQLVGSIESSAEVNPKAKI